LQQQRFRLPQQELQQQLLPQQGLQQQSSLSESRLETFCAITPSQQPQLFRNLCMQQGEQPKQNI